MNRIYIIILISSALLCTIKSCDKDQIIQSEDSITQIKTTFINPKEEVGKFHNEALKYVLENVDEIPNNQTIKLYVENIINSYDLLDDSISLSMVPDISGDITTFDIYNWLEQFNISNNLKKEMLKTFELFQTSDDLDNIVETLKQREQNAANLFKGEDLDKYYEHLAVARYTAIFWFPEEEGGLNGIKFLDENLAAGLQPSKVVNWWKVFGVDCVGGAMGGPGGYLGASAIATIMQL